MKPIIYYIDDEPFNLTVFEAALPAEWDIRTFDNPAEALEDIKSCEPWVVVSDQRMPGMKGVELLSAVKMLWPRAVRMIVTGFSDETLIIDSVRKAQIFDYIRKPWDSDDLEARIEAAIKHFQEECEKDRKIESVDGNRQGIGSDEIEKLRAELEEVTTLSSAIAHDLLEPVRTLKHLVQETRENTQGEDQERLLKVEGVLGRMSDGARSVLKLLRGQSDAQTDAIASLSNVLNDVRLDLEASLKQTGMSLESSGLVSFKVPYHVVRFVLLNLISNALRYGSTPGGKIQVSSHKKEDCDEIVVKDFGPGMDVETQENCVKPFVRGKNTSGSGFGAGLATCKLLLDKIDGRLEIISRMGEGTEFHVKLNIRQAQDQDGPRLRLVS